MILKFIKTFMNYISSRSINNKISRVKYVHLMFNDKFNKPFVDFLNSNFNENEHLILCKNWFKEYPLPVGKNVIKIKTLKYLDFSKVEKLICHSLFDNELIDYLFCNQDVLKEKAYWMIWGGDLYNALRDEKNDFVRENFKGYLTDVDDDIYVLTQRYDCKNKNYYNVGYTFPVTESMLKVAKNLKKDRSSIVIQVNNSCDVSTLDMLNSLSKFKNKNIIIKTILSYGQLKYKGEIIRSGKEIFGDKFEYIDKILPPQEYANYSIENDILILNQNRQQGLGNAFLALNFGQKLFIRSEITTFKHLISKGCFVFDTNLIDKMDFNEFISIDEKIKLQNIQNSSKFFKDVYLKELWNVIFIKGE